MKARIPKNIGGGGAQNMNQMIKQAQKMQDEITALQEDIEARDFTATAGGGAVEVTLSGKKIIKSLNLKPEVVDPEDIEMLQDLIISGVNEIITEIEEYSKSDAGKAAEELKVYAKDICVCAPVNKGCKFKKISE